MSIDKIKNLRKKCEWRKNKLHILPNLDRK